MNRILLEAVPRLAMRPPYNAQDDGGDWFVNPDGDLVVRVIGTDFGNHETFLFALHELIEATLCQARGISQDAVDKFDERFADWPIADPDAEPGDHPAAPYRREHRFACLIEFLMAHELGLRDYGTVR